MGWADYLSRSPSGAPPPPVSHFDASFFVAVCTHVRNVLISCANISAAGHNRSGNHNAPSFATHSYQNIRALNKTHSPFASTSNCFQHACAVLNQLTSNCTHKMSCPFEKITPRAPFSSPDPATTCDSPDTSTTPDGATTSAPPPTVTSVGTQTSLLQTSSEALTVAVLEAVSALRPKTTDATSMTEYTRVGDHLSREFVASLSATHQHLSTLIEYLVTPRPESAKAKLPSHWLTVLPYLHTSEGLLFLDERLVLPHCLQQPVLTLLHSTHTGARAMLSMAEFVWFPHMVREIQCKARQCPGNTDSGKNLNIVRPHASHASTGPQEPVNAPNDELELDFWGPMASNPSSHMYVLVAVDRFSRFPFAMCTPGPTATAVTRFLREYVPLFGCPRRIRSDRGTAFSSHEVTEFCHRHCISQVYSAVADHRGTGTVERLIRTLRERTGVWRVASGPSFNFASALFAVLRDLRVSTHRISGGTPFKQFFD